MKGQLNVATPEEYIAALDEPRKSQVQQLHELICETVPELEPSIQDGVIAYGMYKYKYASGREGEWPKLAIASNAPHISIHCCGQIDGRYVAETYADRLGSVNCGRSCIRFTKIEKLNIDVLKEAFIACRDTDWDSMIHE
jgi:hypothetical protein